MSTKVSTLEEMLQAPFSGDEVKQRPGRAGLTFDYIDSRTAMQRLDDTLGMAGWEFHIKTVIGDKVVGSLTVHTTDGPRTHEDIGYPNGADDDEPLKSAASDALKRCAVHIGVGRHLYFDSVPHGVSRPVVAQRPSVVPTGDGTWVCPDHGAGRVKSNRRGLYCSTKVGEDADGKALWCQHTDSERPIEPRPRVDEPPPPEPPADLRMAAQATFDDLPF